MEPEIRNIVSFLVELSLKGFLKTGSKSSTQGNFGLMDLVAAIHWLRENLPAFDGDPNKIAVMGHGTGASLANILITSPVVSDLIQRAILLSGSALSPWAIQKNPLYVKRKVAEHTGCHGDLVEDDLAPCLRTKSIQNLLSVQLETPRYAAEITVLYRTKCKHNFIFKISTRLRSIHRWHHNYWYRFK